MASRYGHATMKPPRPLWMPVGLINIVILVLFGFILTACTSTESTPAATKGPTEREPSSQATEAEPPAETKAPEDPNAIQIAWEGSPHTDTFVVTGQGTNNICARCHAPAVFIPSMDDIAEACLTCKFEIDPPPPFIQAEEWTNIECNVCHKVSKKGEVEAEYAWLLFLQIQEYEQVASSTELCGKCHAEADLDLPGHESILVDGAHVDYFCTDCHDAHDTTATCSTGGCHEDVLATTADISGHDEDHASVACVACHDASGLEIGLDEERGIWFTFLSPETEGGSFASHNIVLEAPCERCHYPENPWGLIESVSTE